MPPISEHRPYLMRCFDLASLPGAAVEPNPRVGAVVVHNGKIIGEGAHQYFGGPHAEVNAIRAVQDHALLPESTLYVSLEPCNHHGKTPPCTHLILEKGIRKVVVGALDPNPRMAGKSLEYLRSLGIEVILENAGLDFAGLNAHFLLNQAARRAFFTLKWAETADGKIAALDKAENPLPIAISGENFNQFVHALRHEHQGIMVSARTVSIDNPSLSTRKWPGRSPIPIILDSQLSLGTNWKVFSQPKVIILNFKHSLQVQNLQFLKISDPVQWLEVAELLYREAGIGSVLVEGGGIMLGSMLEQNVADKVIVCKSRDVIGPGINAPHFPENNFNLVEKVAGDAETCYCYLPK